MSMSEQVLSTQTDKFFYFLFNKVILKDQNFFNFIKMTLIQKI